MFPTSLIIPRNTIALGHGRLASTMLNRTCDFCYKRKRPCDGLAEKHCSFCALKNQPECHYRPRKLPSQTRAAKAPHSASSAPNRDQTPGHDDGATSASPAPPSTGRSFWRTDLDTTAAPKPAASFSDVGDGRLLGPALPLKRGRFSPSPATGLIGLQENQFLGDFFDCLGFLALTTQSTVGDAMVRIMLAGRSTQYPRHHHRGGASSPFWASPTGSQGQGRAAGEQGLVDEDFGGARQTSFGEIGTSGSCWNNALAAEGGVDTIPRDSSTCILWCAVALGALVRGHPLAQVGRYADLAEDSLRACRDNASLDTARAYIATAIMKDFLGDRVKPHEYLQLAGSIVDELPAETIPRGLHGLLQYAGMAWALEKGSASVEEVHGYWEKSAPVWELPESFGEQDVCGLVLSVTVRVLQPWADKTSDKRLASADEPQPQPPPSASGPMASLPAIEKVQEDAELEAGESPDAPAAEEVSGVIPKNVLSEMIRVQDGIDSSKMDQGVGGLLYYGALTYLQAINNTETTSFLRAVAVFLRFPGLCRYKSWMWLCHAQFHVLAVTKRREKFEELRASYNSVLPPECWPAPPYEEFRGISDICDHAYCRNSTDHVMSVFMSNRATLERQNP